MSDRAARGWLGLCLALYLPHLLEEALAGMHDDPLLAAAWAPLASLSPRHAAYLVFQLTLASGLAALYLAARGGAARALVLWALAAGLLAESHHLLRALASLRYNPGLVTAIPMPAAGWLLARALVSRAGAVAEGARA